MKLTRLIAALGVAVLGASMATGTANASPETDRYAQFGSVIAIANMAAAFPSGSNPSPEELQSYLTTADLGVIGNRFVDAAVTDDSGCIVVAYKDNTPWALYVSEKVQGWTPAATCAEAIAAAGNTAVWTEVTNSSVLSLTLSTPKDILTPKGLEYLTVRWSANAKSDAKTLATQVESYYTEWQKYPARMYPSKADPYMIVFPNGDLAPVSKGSKVRYVVNQKRGVYCIAVTNNGQVAVYASDRGGLMLSGTPVSFCNKYKPTKA